MRIRGERECKNCGTQWSYYETGSVDCPNCGSLQSVGRDERTQHTASAATLDLTEARNLLGSEAAATRTAAERAAETCREFVRGQGFIHAGDLATLDEIAVGARELRQVATEVARGLRTDDDEERYFLDLLGGVEDGERPPPEAVPDSLRAARGRAVTGVVDAYRRDATTYLDDHPDSEARAALATLGEHTKRVDALDGDVPPAHADRLLAVARDIGTYLRENDENALTAARDRLSRFDG